MKLTLHIGTKKTATSTLQHALAVAKPVLAAHGLLFPGTTEDHHRLARRLRDGGADDRLCEALAPIIAEARQAGLGHVLLSSEHLVSIPAGAVARLHGLLAEAAPEAEVRILAYIREPVGFATSMCQQGVKNGIIRLAEFLADPWRFPIADWLGAYVGAFGRANVELRQFHPDHLVAGDVVKDFLTVLGVPGLTLPGAERRRNRSLTAEGVLVADALTGLRPGPTRERALRSAYRRHLTKIAGRRFVLPAEVQDRVIAASRGDLAYLRAEFGLDIRPEPVADCAQADMSPQAALALAERILRQVEG